MIRLIRPEITYGDVSQDFENVFASGMFTRGQQVEAFCQELAAYTGARHAFLTTSATTALWVCLKLIGVRSGDEVVVSDFSFPATANVVEDLGAKPVFADVDTATFNMLPAALEAAITPATKAVIFVDTFGNPTGLHEVKEICSRHGLPLIEDAACAIGSSEKGRRCGSVADLTCFSFHPRKIVCTGEGGAITTSNDEWAAWLEVKLAHGAKGMAGVGLDFVDYGYNFRLPELAAVMGRKQLARLDEIIAARNGIRCEMIDALTPLGFVPQRLGAGVVSNVQSLVFRVPPEVERDALIERLRELEVESTLGTYCLSGTSYFRQRYNQMQANAMRLQADTITLPCYLGLDARAVIEAVRAALS